MAYQIEYAYICHMGKVRTNNEDNFWCCGKSLEAENQGMEEVRSVITAQRSFPLLAVFDGMGGESSGEMAAYLAARTCGECYEENRNTVRENPAQFLEETCRWMNRSVCRYGKENRIGCMGTTAAMVIFGKEQIVSCNLGDSRIYKISQGKLEQISSDHVLKGIRYGKAPLTQYIGIPETQMELEPCLFEEGYRQGDRYLLCSDGMTDMLSQEEIKEILDKEETVKETVQLLLDQVLEKGGRDNVSIILCEVKEKEQRKSRIRQWLEERRR